MYPPVGHEKRVFYGCEEVGEQAVVREDKLVSLTYNVYLLGHRKKNSSILPST